MLCINLQVVNGETTKNSRTEQLFIMFFLEFWLGRTAKLSGRDWNFNYRGQFNFLLYDNYEPETFWVCLYYYFESFYHVL